MTRRSAQDGAAGVAPQLVALRMIAGQSQPVRITCMRPLSVVACEALPHAEALLTGGVRLAVKLPTRAALAHTLAPLPE